MEGLASDLHVLASWKDVFAKCLDHVPHEDPVVDSSLVDSVGWWLLEFRDTGEEDETTLYTNEMGINQERTDWVEFRNFLIGNHLPLEPSFV